MVATQPPTDKRTARAVVLQARAERQPEPGEDQRRTEALLDLTADATTVAAFVSFGTEPSTVAVLAAWQERGVRVLLPVVLADLDLEFRLYDGLLVPGRKGMPCPPPSAPVVPLAEASVVVVPALACDRAGRRLGRGGGSYDRALPRVAPDALTVALVHPEELWPWVPTDPHDVRGKAVLAGDRLVRAA